MINTKNANREKGFQDFSKSDYNATWSFSNFNRFLIAASEVNKLKTGATVLEIGADDSPLKNILINNFNRSDLKWIKTDVNPESALIDQSIIIGDASEPDFWVKNDLNKACIDCAICMEVIEHIDFAKQFSVIEHINNALLINGLLIMTAPTPPFEGYYEKLVWPDDHTNEPTLNELCKDVNRFFKIVKTIGWSLENRELNDLLENNAFLMQVYCKLRNALPDSYIKALIALLAEPKACRQSLLICEKRRKDNFF